MSPSPRTKRKQKPASRPTGSLRSVRPSKETPAEDAPDSYRVASKSLSVKFWGVRGSIPSPGPDTRRYGGNTPCLEIRFGDELCIFDLGSGARALGESLEGAAVRANIFVTHYHYDHLQGLPFFTPIFESQNHFNIFGPSRNGQSVKDILSGQMAQPYFPVSAEAVFRAELEYRDFEEGERLELGDGVITALELNHPGGSLAYRIDHGGKSIVYATDIEHGSELDARFYAFARNADLLIYDAMYTEDEYTGRTGPSRLGWGHSTWQAAVTAATASGAKRLVLFHHEPTRNDAAIEQLLKQVRKHRPEALAARETQLLQA